MTNKTLRKWEKPLVRRLVRPHKEESVLESCKIFGDGGPSPDNNTCQIICAGDCSALHVS